jgi:hypothetical protein
MRFSLLTTLGLAALIAAPPARAADWITAPSYYTHSPETGERVRQYAPIGPFYRVSRQDYQRSGYWHTRSSIQAGGSADHLHIVEEWGRPVRPYGEWRFPYRPFSVPYGAWGPQFFGFPSYGPYGYGFPGPTFPDHRGRDRDAPYPTSPSVEDGRYPPYRSGPRMPDRRFFDLPDLGAPPTPPPVTGPFSGGFSGAVPPAAP